MIKNDFKEILENADRKDWERKFTLWNRYMNGCNVYNCWDTLDEEDKTAIAGDFWYKVTRCGINSSGLVSHNASGKKKKTPAISEKTDEV